MSLDIVYRLRTWNKNMNDGIERMQLLKDAADEIERLREEIDCFEGMKEGVAIRIADLEKRLEGGGGV